MDSDPDPRLILRGRLCACAVEEPMRRIVLIAKQIFLFALLGPVLFIPAVYGQQSKTTSGSDWDKLVEAAKKEGKVTVSVPASSEVKKQLEENFKKRYGIDVEIFTSRGSTGVRRMADEFKAGVRYF